MSKAHSNPGRLALGPLPWAVALVIALWVGAPLAVSQSATCPNKLGTSTPPPNHDNGAHCTPTELTDAGDPIELIDSWPDSKQDWVGIDLLKHGLPFYCEAKDKDRYTVRCKRSGKETGKTLDTNDVPTYSYNIDNANPRQGTRPLPSRGRFHKDTDRPAAIYHLPSGLSKNVDYNFKIQCVILDEAVPGAHADGAPLLVTWDITLS